MAQLLDEDEDYSISRTHLWGAIVFPKLSFLWKQGIGCDVTLVCNDGNVKAPSILLCSLSEKLQTLIALSEDQLLVFLNISKQFWISLLELIYSGKLTKDSLSSTKDFINILLVANALEMNNILSLLHHLVILNKNDSSIIDLTKVSAAAIGNLNLKVECSYNCNGNSFPIVLSNNDVNKITRFFDMNYAKTLTSFSQPTKNKYTNFCISCNGNCVADKIQCLYCFKVIFRNKGELHMKKCHKFCKSLILPYTCMINESNDHYIKGHRISMKSNLINDVWSVHKCDMCDYSTKTFENFIDHFMIHGFFPNFCASCGDIFCNEEIEKSHTQYCGRQHSMENEDTFKVDKLSENSYQHYGEMQENEDMFDVEKLSENSYLHNGDMQEKNDEDDFNQRSNIDTTDVSSICTSDDASLELSDDEEIGIQRKLDEKSQPGITECTQSKCVVCFDKCSASKVMCLLCNEIVPNKISHMLTEHKRCKKAKIWAYTCNIPHFEGHHKSKMIVSKDFFIDMDYYKCQQCDKYYETKQMMFLHLKASHSIMCTFYCCHCESGFTSAVSRNSHQHLCGGGDYIKCEKCQVFFASEELLSQHCAVCLNKGRNKRKHKQKNIEFSEYNENKCVTEKILLTKNVVEKNLTSFEPNKDGTDKSNIWRSICFSCAAPCMAPKVKCIYCLKVVDNNIVHMSEYHPFTPKKSMFVYTCKYLKKSEISNKDCVVSIKEYKDTSNKKDNSFKFKCMKCTQSFDDLSAVKFHLKQNHNICVKICTICHNGFAKYYQWKDHQHFCHGGDLLKCEFCHKIVGCYRAYYDHIWRSHQSEYVYGQANPLMYNLKEQNTKDALDSSDIVKSEIVLQLTYEDSFIQSQESGMSVDCPDVEMRENEGGNVNQDDEAVANESGNIREMFEMVKRNGSDNIIKVCLQCDVNCPAEYVRCIHCMKLVESKEQDAHINTFHPYLPKSKIWPVKCNWLHKELDQHIIAVLSENNSTDYICQLGCSDDLVTLPCQKSVSEHMREVHQMKVFFCTVCKVGMRTRRSRMEHQHFCGGNDLIKCLKCNQIVGTWQGAYQHKAQCLRAASSNAIGIQHKVRSARSRGKKKMHKTQKKEASQYGKYGYEIICGDCKGPCNSIMVKCGLCYEVVPHDDTHMKTSHPFSPCRSWVVYCRLNYSKNKDESVILGHRVPVNKEEVNKEDNCIPLNCPFNFKCKKCDFLSEQKDLLINHIIDVHDEKPLILCCNYCEALMTNKTILQDHSHFCQLGQLYNCDKCDEVFGTHSRLLNHRFINHPPIIDDGNFTASKSNQIVVPEGTILQCIECDFTTSGYLTLKTHNKEQHGYKRHLFCRICYKVFRRESDLERHRHKLHLNGQRCLCETCGKDFEYPRQLRRHIRYFHSGERETNSILHKYRPKKMCAQCGATYKNSNSLMRHIRIIHDKNLFNCKLCSKGFCSASSLRNHTYRHTGEKRYSCPHCDFRSFSTSQVNNHVSKLHPGNKRPYAKTFVFENEEHESMDNETTRNEEFSEANNTSTQIIYDEMNPTYQVYLVTNT